MSDWPFPHISFSWMGWDGAWWFGGIVPEIQEWDGVVRKVGWIELGPIGIRYCTESRPVSGEFLGKEGKEWSERLDSNQRPLSPQNTDKV